MIDIPVHVVSSRYLHYPFQTLCHSGADILHLFPYVQSMSSDEEKARNTEHVDDISKFSLILPPVTSYIASPIPLQKGYSHNDLLLDKIEGSEVKSAQVSDESSITIQTPEKKITQRQLNTDNDQNNEVLTLSRSSLSQTTVASLEELATASNKSLVSIVEGIEDTADVDNLIGMALLYQHMFDKRTSPWEINDFEDGELNNFTIELEKLDRIYYVYHFDDRVASREYELLARMDYNGSKVFVQLSAGCDYTGFDCQGGGEIYVTRRPKLFLKSVVDGSNKPKRIWKALLDDGYNVSEPTEFDLSPPGLWQNVPMLKFLTHMAVYDHREKLAFYPEVLPPLLKDSLDEFIQVRATKDHHDT